MLLPPFAERGSKCRLQGQIRGRISLRMVSAPALGLSPSNFQQLLIFPATSGSFLSTWEYSLVSVFLS